MSRRTFAVALSTLLTLALGLAAAPVHAASAKAEARAQAKHERIVSYWTPARMANAVPRDFAKAQGRFVPAAKGGSKPDKPTGPGGDSGGGSPVTGASWAAGGDVVSGVGKVFFTMGGVNYTCSGSVVDDPASTSYSGEFSLVLTAGHCAYDETDGAFATNWMFIPEYEASPTRTCDGTVHGCWTARGLVVHTAYAGAGGYNATAIKHDWAFAVVGSGGKDGGQLDSEVADLPIVFSRDPEFRHAFGYPAQGKYAGNDLVYCAGDVISDSGMSNETWGMACDMTPGSSGGPWFRAFADGTGELNSVNSYKYTGGPRKNYMFGPKFSTDRTKPVYDAALALYADLAGGIVARDVTAD